MLGFGCQPPKPNGPNPMSCGVAYATAFDIIYVIYIYIYIFICYIYIYMLLVSKEALI